MSLQLLNLKAPSDSKLVSRDFPDDATEAQNPVVEQSASLPLEEELGVLLNRIEPDDLRKEMGVIFTYLTTILDHLQIIDLELSEDSLKQSAAAVNEFNRVSEKARALLGFIETVAMQNAAGDDRLSEVFDSTCYAIEHELQRVFDEELVELQAAQPGHLIRAKILHANGLLRNCFEQTIITLGKVFDPLFDSSHLFNDIQARLEQSLALCKDLSALLYLVRCVERHADRTSIASLAARLKTFRSQTMHYLMYKDWEACERLVKDVLRASGASDLAPVLVPFSCHLELLLGQVKMRGVLRELTL